MSPASDIARLIDAFEDTLGIHLTFYDYSGRLASYLPADRLYHRHPFCRHINANGGQCGAFEHAKDYHRLLEAHPAGFFKCCHAGVVEFAIPLKDHGRVLGVAMAGPFVWRSGAFRPRLPYEAATSLPLRAKTRSLQSKIPPITPKTMVQTEELMRAFSARIESLLAATHRVKEGNRQRRWVVENLVGRRFAHNLSLEDLARDLGVSASRARHVVRELFGCTFTDLVRSHRLIQAKQLLTNSHLSIPEIAEQCGFNDASNFHKAFKKHEGTTPHRYRVRHRNV